MLAALVRGFVEHRESLYVYNFLRLFAEYCLPANPEIAGSDWVILGHTAAYITINPSIEQGGAALP